MFGHIASHEAFDSMAEQTLKNICSPIPMVHNLNHPGNFGAVYFSLLPPAPFILAGSVLFMGHNLSLSKGGLHVSLWFAHQGFPLHYFLNSINLDPGIGQEGNSLKNSSAPRA